MTDTLELALEHERLTDNDLLRCSIDAQRAVRLHKTLGTDDTRYEVECTAASFELALKRWSAAHDVVVQIRQSRS
jgi:hypothetical protein